MPVKRTTNAAEVKRLADLAKDMEQKEVAAGWLSTAKYQDGTPVAYVASIQEFGNPPHLPPRPYMRPTVTGKTPEWTKKYAHILKSATSGEAVLEVMGGVIAGDFREAISEVQSPPLAKATLAARKRRGNGSTKPLVDTRIMINTLTHIVRPKGS